VSEILFKPSVIPTNDSSIDPKVAFPTFNDHYVNGFVPLISEKLAKSYVCKQMTIKHGGNVMNQGVNEQFVKVIPAATLGKLEAEINLQITRASPLYILKDCRLTKADVGFVATLIFEVRNPSESKDDSSGIKRSNSVAKEAD